MCGIFICEKKEDKGKNRSGKGIKRAGDANERSRVKGKQEKKQAG